MNRRSFVKSTSMLGFGAMAALNCKAGVDNVKAAQHKQF